MTENDESGPQEGGAPLSEESGQPADGEEGRRVRMVDLGLPGIESGAALDADEDSIAEVADTSLDMEGFETGAEFDLEGRTDEVDRDIEIQMMEIRSSPYGEADFQQAETSDSAGPVLEEFLVDGGFGGSEGGVPRIPDNVDLTIPDVDHGSLLLPTPIPRKAEPKRRHRGLEELERRQKRRSGVRQLVTATSTVLILGGGGFAMAYWGVVEIPGITPPERSRFAGPAPVVLPGPQPETPVMSHVVFVDTWREIQTPLAMADALQEQMPDLLGFVTTLLIDGDRHYALMVGPAYSAVEANDLKVPLAAAFDLLNPDPESWAVREAPYSFFLGEYETLGEANGRVRELADLSVPAFVLQVTYSAEARALRVYGGAFSDEFQAGEMGRLLSENDLGDNPLTERRGRLPE